MQSGKDEDLRNTVLNAPIGICILDAATLVSEIVNEKFLEVAGKPFEAIYGKFYWDAFSEARIYYEAALNQVVENGQPYHSEEVELMLIRHGKQELVFVTFVYSPIKDQDGKVIKVSVWVLENTKQVAERQKVEIERLVSQKERDRLTRFFMQAPAGICILDGPEFVYELVNPLYQQLFPGRELLGKPLLDVVPEISGTPIEKVLRDVYETGKTFAGNELLIPLAKTSDGPVEDRYFNFIYQARYDQYGLVDGILVFVSEVTENVLVKQKIVESEANLKTMLETLPQMTWTNTTGAVVNFYNQRWFDYTGLNFEQTKALGWEAVVHPDDLKATWESLSEIMENNEGGEFENRYKRRDGIYRWHLNRMMPIKLETGEVDYWIGTATDIEDIKQLQQQKDDFISIASHELKTPITSLKASLQLLDRVKDNPLPGMVTKLINLSNKSVEKVSILIEDLLNSSKNNAGQLHLNQKKLNIGKIINDCCNHVRTEGNYSIKTSGNLDLQVFADSERTDQVMINLVNNAVKYAPASRDVIVHVARQGNMARISVTDKGPGIAADKLPHLFERYYQVDDSGKQISGLGLGLYISSEIIKKHGGQIGVQSKIGGGSTFWFTLPLDQT